MLYCEAALHFNRHRNAPRSLRWRGLTRGRQTFCRDWSSKFLGRGRPGLPCLTRRRAPPRGAARLESLHPHGVAPGESPGVVRERLSYGLTLDSRGPQQMRLACAPPQSLSHTVPYPRSCGPLLRGGLLHHEQHRCHDTVLRVRQLRRGHTCVKARERLPRSLRRRPPVSLPDGQPCASRQHQRHAAWRTMRGNRSTASRSSSCCHRHRRRHCCRH